MDLQKMYIRTVGVAVQIKKKLNGFSVLPMDIVFLD